LNKTKKIYLVILLLLFLLLIPLLQSLIFSHQKEGVITINKEITVDFIQSDQKNILLYFGYVGCSDICTPFLENLSRLYESEEFKKLQAHTDIFFINLTPYIEPSQADQFAKSFNKNFQGIYLTRKEVLSIDRNFKLFFSDDLSDTTKINHTDYLYHIQNTNNTKSLKNIYFTHPLSTQKLIDAMMYKTELKMSDE